MRYELDLVGQLCREIGLPVRDSDHRVEIDLGRGAVLCFQNAEREEDCLIGLLATPGPERLTVGWHAHSDHLTFVGARGYYIELDYLDLLACLKEGQVLICEREVDGQTVDCWLVLSEYNDEFTHLEEGERIIVRRAKTQAAPIAEP